MLIGFGSAIRLLAVLGLSSSLVLAQVAEPAPPAQPGPLAQPLDRHARKVQKTLASYPPESMVMVTMNDSTTRLGTLGELRDAGFELTRRDGSVVRIQYAKVHRVQKADAVTANRVVVGRHHGVVHHVIVVAAVIGLVFVLALAAAKS